MLVLHAMVRGFKKVFHEMDCDTSQWVTIRSPDDPKELPASMLKVAYGEVIERRTLDRLVGKRFPRESHAKQRVQRSEQRRVQPSSGDGNIAAALPLLCSDLVVAPMSCATTGRHYHREAGSLQNTSFSSLWNTGF